ncbi:MAG: hypothetical protein ACYTF5_00060 [Planctomycetota bacterium]|jgi:hypothetical protein
MPTIPRLVVLRALLVVVATAVSVVLMAGGHALWTGTSFLHGWLGLGVESTTRMAMTDEERIAAAALTRGPFSLAVDPHVAFTMRRGATRKILDVPAHMDKWGMRRRVGPTAVDSATRIAVLGDSVAFGVGVEDDQTIAHQLEELLAGTMAAGQPRPVVFTVACPSWNNRNACRYLKNHVARLRPDIVMFMPVGNDIHDSYAINEVGHPSLEFDPALGAGEAHTSTEQWNLLVSLWKRAPTVKQLEIVAAGGPEAVPHVTLSGLSPESKRRWRAIVADIRDLHERLQARGSRLAATFFRHGPYEFLFRMNVGEAVPAVPIVWTVNTQEAYDQLPQDPHPNAEFARALAWYMAEFLLEKGWVPGAGSAPLPPLDERYARRKSRQYELVEVEEILSKFRATWTQFFESRIDLSDCTGFHQIYGAVYADGMVDRNLRAALRCSGQERLQLTIDRLPVKTGLYPLRLAVHINGALVRDIPVPPPAEGDDTESKQARHTLEVVVPERLRTEPFLDINIKASNWVVEQYQGTSRLASFRFQNMSLLAGKR